MRVSKSVQTMITASLIVAIVPIFYLVLFIAQARRDASLATSVPGYLTEESCENKNPEGCILVTTVQKDQYWISN